MTDTVTFSEKLVFKLLELHKERRTGILRAERGPTKKQFVVRQGRLSFAESNAPEEHLARIMVSMNLLPKATLAGIATMMKEKKTSDEAILATGKAGTRELEEGARQQALVVLSSLMEWDSGGIKVYTSDPGVRRQFDLALPLPDLIVAAARQASSRRPISPAYSPLNQPICQVPENKDALLILPLDRLESLVLSLTAEPVEVEILLARLAPEHPKPEDLILRLMMLGLVRKHVAAGEQAAVPEDKFAELDQRMEELLMRFESADLYEILGVAPDAAEDRIKEAYHALAKQYHPDRFQSKEYSESLKAKAQALFTSMTGAYSTLADADSRSAYDRERQHKRASSDRAATGRESQQLDRENMAEVLFRAGYGRYLKGDYDKAIEKLKECVWLKPDVAKYRCYLGCSQAEVSRQRKEAEQNLLKAIELDQTLVESHLALGRLYLKAGMPRKAETQLKEVLRWKHGDAEAEKLLREIASMEGREKK